MMDIMEEMDHYFERSKKEKCFCTLLSLSLSFFLSFFFIMVIEDVEGLLVKF